MTNRTQSTQIPTALVHDLWTDVTTFRVYAVLAASCPARERFTRITLAELAERSGIRPRTVSYSLAKLTAAGWITRDVTRKPAVTTLNAEATR